VSERDPQIFKISYIINMWETWGKQRCLELSWRKGVKSLFRQPFIPTTCYSDNPLFRQPFILATYYFDRQPGTRFL